jgi:hypothetical protein
MATKLTKNVLLAMQEALSSRNAGTSPSDEFGADSEYARLWDKGYYEKASDWIAEQIIKRGYSDVPDKNSGGQSA